jgi:hypothetical protein
MERIETYLVGSVVIAAPPIGKLDATPISIGIVHGSHQPDQPTQPALAPQILFHPRLHGNKGSLLIPLQHVPARWPGKPWQRGRLLLNRQRNPQRNHSDLWSILK